jgi:hypothetical protein
VHCSVLFLRGKRPPPLPYTVVYISACSARIVILSLAYGCIPVRSHQLPSSAHFPSRIYPQSSDSDFRTKCRSRYTETSQLYSCTYSLTCLSHTHRRATAPAPPPHTTEPLAAPVFATRPSADKVPVVFFCTHILSPQHPRGHICLTGLGLLDLCGCGAGRSGMVCAALTPHPPTAAHSICTATATLSRTTTTAL